MVRLVLFGIIAVFALSGCGGDGAWHDAKDFSGVTLEGVVEDGPLEEARVFLRHLETGEVARYCGASGVGRCEARTNEDGSFSLRVSLQALGEPLELFTNGGFDRQTGVDFAGIPMRAPLDLFADRLDRIRVTPLTSVLSARMRGGVSMEAAAGDIALELALPSDTDFGSPIAGKEGLLHKALVLTALAIELSEGGESDPFAFVGARLDGAFPLLTDPEGRLDPLTLQEWGLGPGVPRLLSLDSALHERGAPLCAVFRKVQLRVSLEEAVALMLPESDLDHPHLRRNLEALAEKILSASGDTPLPVRGLAPGRIARYILFTHGLTTFEALSADPAAFAEQLPAIKDDGRIAELAALRTRYAVSVFLLEDEMPGNDNQRRIEYFYNSDVSPFYQAEKLLALVFDDQIRDPLLVEIAWGMAEVGLIAEATAVIETQIHLSEFKARGYRLVAEALTRYGKKDEAVEILRKAEHFARRFTEHKGANLATTDAQLLQAIGAAFRKAGDAAGATRMRLYLEEFIPHLNTPALFGRVIVATWQMADEYIADGDEGAALPLIESMEALALKTPPNEFAWGKTYRARVHYLRETARRYADLGRGEDVVAVWRTVQSIRQNDGLQNLTEGDTWSLMAEFVEILYQVGHREEALELADQIPATHSGRAYMIVATYEAIDGNFAKALEVIDKNFSTPQDKIEALTYFALNKSREYIALALIRRGELETAGVALDMAAELVKEIQTATERVLYQQVIQRGYVKIADLYHMAGDDARAFEMLTRAEEVIATMAGLQNVVDGLVDLLLGYHQIGEEAIADELLLTAAGALRDAAGILPFDLAGLYNKVMGVCLDIGNRDAALEILPRYAAVARTIFDPHAVYSGTDRDRQLRRQVDHLARAARYGRRLSDPSGARDLLFEAAETARLIFVEKERVEAFVGPPLVGSESIVTGLAAAGFFDAALELVNEEDAKGRFILTKPGRNRGLLAIAEVYAHRDDFPDTKVASIDFDGDGRPFFFHPFATPEEILASGLVLDDDSDGDGIPDRFDRRPLFIDPFPHH